MCTSPLIVGPYVIGNVEGNPFLDVGCGHGKWGRIFSFGITGWRSSATPRFHPWRHLARTGSQEFSLPGKTLSKPGVAPKWAGSFVWAPKCRFGLWFALFATGSTPRVAKLTNP
jgi:hypothetical protein